MEIKIALAGNPNSGKTTLFNALTGSNQFVGNWPGVTVEKKEGKLKKREGVIVTDLPGIYSLSPYTPEEVVARKYLVNERPDAILNIVDGTNLERNLYLTTQLAELGIPTVIALNMADIVRKNGDEINIEGLSKALRCPIVEISALKEEGITEAIELAINAAIEQKAEPMHIFSGEVEHALAHIEEAVVHELPKDQQRWYAIKLFERDKRVYEALSIPEKTIAHIEEDIVHVEDEFDDDAESIIANERYIYIQRIVEKCVKKKNVGKLSVSDKIDRIVTNRFLALPIFAVIMFLVYYISVSTVGTWATDWANDGLFGEGFNIFGRWIDGVPVLAERGLDAINVNADWLRRLIIDGIIGGVGAVLGFVPQMIVLFLFLSFLESCGYMSRIAFMMDKLFRKLGLSGKSFIPMLVGSGCGVPGIMASRTIENEQERRMTIMTTTFIPCGAKLPVIGLIASSLFGGAWWVAPSAYFLGVTAIVVSGIMLKKTKLFYGEPSPFVMELPAYHMPTFNSIFYATWERSSSFVKKAGTVILLSSMLIWAGSHFGFIGNAFTFSREMALDESLLGYLGSAIKWIFAPLGFGNIESTVATIMGLVAKEEIVAVFGVLGFKGIGPLAAYSFLAFNLLCAPCFAAIGAIRREMNSPKWTVITITYQCVFAYAVSLMIYQFGSAVMGNINVVGFIFATLVAMYLAYMLARKPYKPKK
ncbi:MAG: ferrous iron transport protein B [Clostridia bacterium]|nr:ferrous iron transport protein B [Clostridia bacterium]